MRKTVHHRDLIYKKLRKEGTLTIATDSIDYSQEIIDLFSQEKVFQNLHQEKGYTNLTEEYGGSYFEKLWKDLGRINKLLSFKKVVEVTCALPRT